MPLRTHLHSLLFRSLSVLALTVGAVASQAQTEPAPAASAPPTATPAKDTTKLAPVEITGSRPSDLQERRQSTAAKIVIGREEIEKYGDSTLGEVLKRLPGVTLSGPPGRGSGGPRMRGLGSGYTLILLDGQRVPPGFSIESLEPDQVERIEILRAPTAETGARAIAGVINIVTREGFRKKLNNLRLGTGIENGHAQPGFSWTRNDSVDDLIYNWTLSANRQDYETNSVTTRQKSTSGVLNFDQTDTSTSREQRNAVHANARLQWRGDKGTQLVLQPMLVCSEGDTERHNVIDQRLGPVPYERADTTGSGNFSLARLNGEYRQSLGEGSRFELKTGVGQNKARGDSVRYEYLTGNPTRTRTDHTNTDDTTFHLNGKYTTLLVDDHSLVSGLEVESNRRVDGSTTLYNGTRLPSDAGDSLTARTLRLAAYAQDEWTVSPQWSAHAGLRWEGIRVDSDGFDTGGVSMGDVSNRSSVWTPLLHAVWKPEPKSNDQVRISLTRTYRSPSLQSLIARPSPNTREPLLDPVTDNPQTNSLTAPDRVGNPNLKPELATGLDVAFEHYIPSGGLLSANVFYRHISNYMRTVTSTTAQTVSYSPVPRYISRTENVGDAATQGLELEARFRLSEAIEGAPKVDMRLNASLFRSRVKPVPGPDNRLDQQPDGTANIGADYKIPGLPLSVGGNLNWTPGYTTRVTELQTTKVGNRLQGDAFVAWTLNPSAQLRVSASNLAPRDYVTGSRFEDTAFREVSETTTPTRVNWQLRLELKL